MSKLLFIPFFFLCSQAFGADLPENLKICKRNDPNLNNCVQDSINELQQYTRHGDVKYGIPYLERMYIKSVLREKPVGPRKQLQLSMNHTNIYGLSEYVASKVNVDLKEKYIKFDLHINSLRVEGNYKLTGRYYLIRVNASDKVHGYLSNVDCFVRMNYRLVDIQEKQHIEVTDTRMFVVVNSGNMVLDNIFPNNRTMTKTAQKKINKRFKIYIKELLSSLNLKFSERFTEIGNKFFSKYTYDQLFPEA